MQGGVGRDRSVSLERERTCIVRLTTHFRNDKRGERRDKVEIDVPVYTEVQVKFTIKKTPLRN